MIVSNRNYLSVNSLKSEISDFKFASLILVLTILDPKGGVLKDNVTFCLTLSYLDLFFTW